MAVTELARGTATRRPARKKGDGKAAALFLAPWFVGLALITAGPMAASLYLSFTDYNLLQAPSWIGWDNYERMFADPRLLNSLQVTFTYVFVSVPLQLAAALGLALLLDKGLRGLAVYRSIYYLPSLLGGSVAIAILWRQVFGADGLINQVLALVGIEGQGWVSHPDYALGTLVALNVWTFGAPMIIFLAGLRQIPRMYYEAASIDGAGRWRQFRSITVPMLTPIIFFNLVLQLINAFQSFTQAFVVSGGTGGPADSTMFYTLYLYLKGFGSLEMGYASAMAWFLLLIIGGMTFVNFLASKYWVFYDD
ncbi:MULTISPECIES: carbohydrate ABC transporter permease [Cellulosimicrobium]|uniref:ABC transporter permease n=2 Tax=Cellulosimicrobium TaxID=157920 RepID=A0A0H2KWD8_9MICO|nr:MULTISPECIES: sugar ABC transporter permease [Cellulosimicrobium]KLN36129.1 ABC transporter permease [Cellulosimicrobium funkei]KON75116.1 ABC transporter permease [Cellulosimicrobium cellulans F16]KZM79529.1 ABC transporter permease [Cellulosimicrobium sp. I38E]